MYSLWLRDELFLMGHDEAGKPVVHEATLAAGLAGAMLLDLVFTGRLRVSQHRVGVADGRPVGDAAGDALIGALIGGTAPIGTRALVGWLAQDSYERSSATLIAAGLLRKILTRRLGLVPVTRYQIVDETVVIRIRGRLRSAVHGREQANAPTAALGALVRVVRLDSQLYSSLAPGDVLSRLDVIASGLDPGVMQIVSAVEAVVAMSAVSAFR
jgi:hypothetical protein